MRVLESAPKNVVLSKSRGSPGQWFPETEYFLASAIFVMGTSGIPSNLNYLSVSPILFTHKWVVEENWCIQSSKGNPKSLVEDLYSSPDLILYDNNDNAKRTFSMSSRVIFSLKNNFNV